MNTVQACICRHENFASGIPGILCSINTFGPGDGPPACQMGWGDTEVGAGLMPCTKSLKTKRYVHYMRYIYGL